MDFNLLSLYWIMHSLSLNNILISLMSVRVISIVKLV